MKTTPTPNMISVRSRMARKKVFWKIAYCNRALTSGSRHPADPAITKRVLTIMLAQEY